MNVTYTDAVRQSAEGLAVLQPVNKQLEEVLAQGVNRVQAEWDRREDDHGRPVYTLRLVDSGEALSADFAPWELRSAREVRSRLLTFWGDLLQVRSDKLIANLTRGSDGEGE